jgi:hypothetical protein
VSVGVEVLKLPPWWQVLDNWNLVDDNPARIAFRVRRIQRNKRDRRRLHNELLSSYPLDPSNADALYDPLLSATGRPLMRHVGFTSVGHEGSLDAAVRSGCLAYATVAVTDPVWISHRVCKWATETPPAGYSAAEIDDMTIRWTTFIIETYLAYLIPLARCGVIAFDSLWGPGEMNSLLGWTQLPGPLNEALGALPANQREIAAEAVWAAIRAKTLNASVGTSDDAFADVLRMVDRHNDDQRLWTRQAVEVPILLPFVQPVPVSTLLALRVRHADTLQQFRASLGAMTRELEAMPQSDLRKDLLSQVVHDYLAGELAKLDREWKGVKLFRYGAAAASGASLTTIAVALGVSGSPLGAGWLALASAGVAASAAVAALGMDAVRLKGNNHYILWRAARHRR